MQSLLPSLRRRTIAQRAVRGPLLLLLLALLLVCTGTSALPSPLRWDHAAVAAGWAALLLGAPALLLGPQRETIAAGGAAHPIVPARHAAPAVGASSWAQEDSMALYGVALHVHPEAVRPPHPPVRPPAARQASGC